MTIKWKLQERKFIPGAWKEEDDHLYILMFTEAMMHVEMQEAEITLLLLLFQCFVFGLVWFGFFSPLVVKGLVS